MADKMNHYWLISIFILLMIFFSGINITYANLTTRVSVNSSGIEGNLNSQHSSISADGRYVAFTSLASNLITNDTNNKWDVFVHDRKTGITTRVSEGVSVDITGVEGNGDSLSPSISADGRYVAFHSIATNLAPGDTNNTWDVFVHDRQTKYTKRVSKSTNNIYGESNNLSQNPTISADGSFVAFHSYASNLVASDLNNKADIFVHDIITGNTARVSKSSTGTEGNGDSLNASISADGRYVAFSSLASNLTVKDTNGYADIFLHDRYTGAIVKISASTIGLGTNNSSDYPSVSYDGRYVAFQSNATNLVSNDTNARTDIFVCDRQTGTTSRVSIDSSGNQANNYSYYPFINTDGRYVAFHSIATNLVSADTNGASDIFRHDRNTGTTERININNSGGQAEFFSSYRPSMSSDGRYISFYSLASNLVAGDGNSTWDTFVRHPEIDPSVLDISITGMNDRKSDVANSYYSNQSLFVWESNGSIMGQIRGSDGSIIRDKFTILPAANSITYLWPAITQTGVTIEDYFLVAKMVIGGSLNPQEQIIGVHVSSTGDIIDSPILVSDLFYQNSSTLDGQPDVACESRGFVYHSNVCLVVWKEHKGLNSTILGQGINVRTGALSGARLNITSIDSGVIGSLAIAFGQTALTNTNNGFFVVYNIIPDAGIGYIAHKIVSPDDSYISAESVISDGSGATPIDPDVAYKYPFEFLVVWDNGNIIGQFVDSEGFKIGNNFIINTPECLPPYYQICGSTSQPAVSDKYDPTGDFLVTYYVQAPIPFNGSNILGTNVFGNGSFGTEFIVFSDTGLPDINPALDCEKNGCLISWEHEAVVGGMFDIYGKYIPSIMNLNIIKEGTGSGTVTSSPAGINCGTDCSEPYIYGTVVTLATTASPASTFTGWVFTPSDCSDSIVTMDENLTCKATFAKTLFEETDLSIAYTGKWTNYSCKGCSGGAIKYSGGTGSRATLSFTGAGIRWFAAKSYQLGKGKVFIDGVNTALVDLYNPTTQAKQKVYETTGLTQGIHTIAIEVSGQKNPASTGVLVDLDYFEVVP